MLIIRRTARTARQEEAAHLEGAARRGAAAGPGARGGQRAGRRPCRGGRGLAADLQQLFSSREQAIVAAVTAEREARVAAAVAARPASVRLADADRGNRGASPRKRIAGWAARCEGLRPGPGDLGRRPFASPHRSDLPSARHTRAIRLTASESRCHCWIQCLPRTPAG